MRLTKEQEIELWKRWKQTKGQYEFNQLLVSFDPLINKAVNTYSRGSNLSPAIYKAEAIKWFIKGKETYDPSKGAALSTHLSNYLKKLYRFNLTHQNVGRIQSEKRAGMITTFNNARSYLEDQLGREPNTNEIADELGVSPMEVSRLQKDLRKDLAMDETFDSIGTSMASNPKWDALMSIYHFECTPEEKLVMEYIFGLGGKPRIDSVQEIGMKANIPPNRVSQIKKRLHKKVTGEK